MLLGLIVLRSPNTQPTRQQSVEPGQARGSNRKRNVRLGYVRRSTQARARFWLNRRACARAVFLQDCGWNHAPLRSAAVSLSSHPMPLAPSPDIVVVHSSDLHIDHDYTAGLHGGDGTAGLSSVLSAARGAGADVVVLAGDTFDCHRLPAALLDRAAAIISQASLPVGRLPGNHAPAVPDAVYHRAALSAVDNLHVLGVTMTRPSSSPRWVLKFGAARTATMAT